LVQAREAAVDDLRRKHQAISSMLLKHGRASSGKTTWGAGHERWLAEQAFDHPAQQVVLQELILPARHTKERLERIEAAIVEFMPRWSLAPFVEALQALRGIRLPTAATIAAEIGDLGRFDSARQFMGYLGLVPGERSTGETVRRLVITKAGNGRIRRALIESALPTGIRRGSGRTSSTSIGAFCPQSATSPGRLRHGSAVRIAPSRRAGEADGRRRRNRAGTRRVHLGNREGGEARLDPAHPRRGHRAG
jgi:transposase